jgi:8-oxo-dGTP pyrophosphatase MutT (NUDIX family)
MYITVYFGTKPIYLCNQKEPVLERYFHKPDCFLTESCSPEALLELVQELEQENINTGLAVCNDMDLLFETFCSLFTLITAAGGIVENENKDILLIFRRGKWDLPKGKLDKGETIEACAVREVKEETGLQNVQIIRAMPSTHHTYQEAGKKILKRSVWYQMYAPGKQELQPQAEEDITEIKWVPVNELTLYLNNTFPSVKDVLTFHLAGSL